MSTATINPATGKLPYYVRDVNQADVNLFHRHLSEKFSPGSKVRVSAEGAILGWGRTKVSYIAHNLIDQKRCSWKFNFGSNPAAPKPRKRAVFVNDGLVGPREPKRRKPTADAGRVVAAWRTLIVRDMNEGGAWMPSEIQRRT